MMNLNFNVMISIWEKESFFAPQDIVIAGSGFVGLWSAFYLKRKKPDLKITIVDRGIIPTGASTRNAGFACFGSLSELIHDGETMGTGKMLELVEMRYRGLKRIQKYFPTNQIDFDLCGGYELYDDGDKISSKKLSHNIEYLNTLLNPIIGNRQTFRLSDKKIAGFGFGKTKHLIKNKAEGYLHSGKLVKALLQTVQSMGVQIFTNTEIKSFERTNGKIELRTNQPFSLTTKQLLICTNAFAKELLPELDIVPARGQVLVTSEITDLPWQGTFHSDEGFYYFRNLGKKVLLGGARNKAFEEEETSQLQTTIAIQNELEKYLGEVILPAHKGKYSIDYRWSGIMAMGSEKMPIMKQLEPGVFCAVRMSGMGVALAPIVGQSVVKLML
jgi:glycine/D-amino acid oxidase-like deaminating enzyme